MSIHKLTAGSGYDYLTRQVAALDATEKGHTGLAGYYTAKGEAPGVWVGSGMAGIEGLAAGDVVTAEQMASLFGGGRHPLAAQRRADLEGPGLSSDDYKAVSLLGAPFKVYTPDVSAFRVEVARRIADINRAAGLPGDWPVPLADRARVRTEVATEFFRSEHGRDPADAREIAAAIATHSRPRTSAVAGYDLTFSPVKSVSALWAVADPATAAVIERAHRAAVADALTFIEAHALFTRVGTNGVRQVNARGIVATAFTHRDSRAGDPDLHTHVAVANKVQTDDGRWLSIDGRLIFKANVAASETYNTALEHHLGDLLGVRFAERPDPDDARKRPDPDDARKRPVREIVGVDPRLNQRWSARRVSIQARRCELTTQFQRTHGRPPTPVESIQLAQRATLETRDAKHEPRSLAEQRAIWAQQAADVLGGEQGVRRMVRQTLSPSRPRGDRVNAAWMDAAADRILHAIQTRRSTWQTWHVRAEALRQVRAADVPTAQVDRVVGLLVDEVLERRSVQLTTQTDEVVDPDELRRRDGASVYTVAGADLYSSTDVLAAEQRIVARAGHVDGHTVPSDVVDLALLEATANGRPLNAGQAALVRAMATSGARVQLAIAPAGSGKTTAMRTLAAAWTDAGGTVVGLAPSATAAAALGEQMSATTDTLAKLTWSIENGDLPGWAKRIGPTTLVIVDEAGMADTLSLDRAVEFVVGRGGSVRLIGDDQQLAAIGAGGVLRDIVATHGAAQLSELMRFADPAEGAASMALRAGHNEALGFYLDQGRVHVGDQDTMTQSVFDAWRGDQLTGKDAVMLAPTRELVAELNRRAQQHLRAGADPSPHVGLGDGNEASPGDVVITRSNDRRLRISRTDWVKNGDRWTVRSVGADGSLTVQHHRNQLVVTLPADYVRTCTELGYACTIHAAQGLTADSCHTLITGAESRQLLYTALTRGRLANHLYLEVVGDSDPHGVVRPDTVHPPTATDMLQRILAHDDAPQSATTLHREHSSPASQLGHATARYLDALYLAAETTVGQRTLKQLEATADDVVPGLTDQPAWPTLRAHLLLLGAHGADPALTLQDTATARELDTAADAAAVLDWRLDDTGLRNAGPGPLPWLPGIPPALRSHPTWGDYLNARQRLVANTAEQVREQAKTLPTPPWARQAQSRPADVVVGDIAVWRAAMQVDPADRRPTGPTQLGKAANAYQRSLDQCLSGQYSPATTAWRQLLEQVAPTTRHDTFTPMLAERMAHVSRTGLDAHTLLRSALQEGHLPDDHAAAALWWRVARHLSPAVAEHVGHGPSLATPWTPGLADIVGADRAEQFQRSSWWPSLVTTVDHALAHGWSLQGLLGGRPTHPVSEVDECQALVWRISVLNDPPPSSAEPDPWPELDHHDPSDNRTALEPEPSTWDEHHVKDVVDRHDLSTAPRDSLSAETILGLAAMARGGIAPLQPTDAQVNRMIARAYQQDTSPVPLPRIAEVNALALAYYESTFPRSWADTYLTQRLGQNLAGDPRVRPGYAPTGWTHLVSHLNRCGVSDEEMAAAGVATVARTGRLIDRFRDRAVLPIMSGGQILGFVGRRRPVHRDDEGGPKYLNTAETALFRKGDQLYGVALERADKGAVPVLVEGPVDAIAVTLASAGRYVGVAPLGTALTEQQAVQLANLRVNPVVATDADLAGHLAAHRDFWLLAQHGMDPLSAKFSDGADPADTFSGGGPRTLLAALDAARPMSDDLIAERLNKPHDPTALRGTLTVMAAASPTRWDAATITVAAALDVTPTSVQAGLAAAVRQWHDTPRAITGAQLSKGSCTRMRPEHSDRPAPDRWRELAHQLDPRLTRQDDWPALADMLDRAHVAGHDVSALTRELVRSEALTDRPAQDLRYRLVMRLPVGTWPNDQPTAPTSSGPVGEHERREAERRSTCPPSLRW